MRTVYNQNEVTVTIDGVQIQDFFEGAPIVYTWDGGEVQKTEGTDGPGINIATNQGSTLQLTLRETSRSLTFLQGIRMLQENGGPGVVIVLRTGAEILLTMLAAFMSRPGQLSTGDKQQGGIEYTFVSADETISGLMVSTVGSGTQMG